VALAVAFEELAVRALMDEAEALVERDRARVVGEDGQRDAVQVELVERESQPKLQRLPAVALAALLRVEDDDAEVCRPMRP
jgi:hypothetical protein